MTISLGMKLDENLKTLMNKNQIKLAELAKEVGLAKSTIYGWINGAQPRSVLELNKVAKYFGLNIHELCFGEDGKQNEKYIEQKISQLNDVELILRKIKR